MQIRVDHFDQMLSMIQESNVGKTFYINNLYLLHVI